MKRRRRSSQTDPCPKRSRSEVAAVAVQPLDLLQEHLVLDLARIVVSYMQWPVVHLQHWPIRSGLVLDPSCRSRPLTMRTLLYRTRDVECTAETYVKVFQTLPVQSFALRVEKDEMKITNVVTGSQCVSRTLSYTETRDEIWDPVFRVHDCYDQIMHGWTQNLHLLECFSILADAEKKHHVKMVAGPEWTRICVDQPGRRRIADVFVHVYENPDDRPRSTLISRPRLLIQDIQVMSDRVYVLTNENEIAFLHFEDPHPVSHVLEMGPNQTIHYESMEVLWSYREGPQNQRARCFCLHPSEPLLYVLVEETSSSSSEAGSEPNRYWIDQFQLPVDLMPKTFM